VGAVDERLGQVELAACDQIVGERLQHLLQNAGLNPTLEATEARRVRRVPSRHVGPRSAGPEDPQNAVEHVAGITPRPSAAVVAHLRRWEKLLDCCPLLIGQVHFDLRSQT
jgi:hypothetical protein